MKGFVEFPDNISPVFVSYFKGDNFKNNFIVAYLFHVFTAANLF